MDTPRTCTLHRATRETEIALSLNLDGSGRAAVQTGVPFLDHMLNHLAMHGLFDLEITCRGDTEIDDHHSVEDIGIALGQAFAQALGDGSGLTRYGAMTLPMDEALAQIALDFSGRGLLVYRADLPTRTVGRFDTQLVPEFLRALAHNAGLTLHVTVLHGSNTHHIVEAIFKALGRTLCQAVSRDPRRTGIASTKGVL